MRMALLASMIDSDSAGIAVVGTAPRELSDGMSPIRDIECAVRPADLLASDVRQLQRGSQSLTSEGVRSWRCFSTSTGGTGPPAGSGP